MRTVNAEAFIGTSAQYIHTRPCQRYGFEKVFTSPKWATFRLTTPCPFAKLYPLTRCGPSPWPAAHMEHTHMPTPTQASHAPHTQLTLDFSAAKDSWRCLEYYRRRYVQHLVPVGEEFSPSLAIGDAYHQSLAALQNGQTIDAALALFDVLYTTAYDAADCTDTVRTPYVGRAMLHAYYQKWGITDSHHVEVGAAVDMDLFTLYGKIDDIWADEFHTVVDHKTTSGLIWLPTARPNWQLVGYAHMVRTLTGIEPRQVCVDGIVWPRIGKRMQEKVLPPEQEFALTQHDNLHRRVAPLYERDYAEWHTWISHTASVILHCLEHDRWPMNAPQGCTMYNRDCDYMPLCKAPTLDTVDRLVEALYVVKPWHPYDADGGA